MALPLTTALNLQSSLTGAAIAPIPAATGGGLLSGIMGGIGGIMGGLAGPVGLAASLFGGSGMLGGGMESSSASTTTNFYEGSFQVGGNDETPWILAGVIVLLLILLARGK